MQLNQAFILCQLSSHLLLLNDFITKQLPYSYYQAFHLHVNFKPLNPLTVLYSLIMYLKSLPILMPCLFRFLYLSLCLHKHR